MGTLYRFPGCATGDQLKAAAEVVSRATDLLHAIRDRLPRQPIDTDAEYEVEVLGRAIQAIQAARPLHGDPADFEQTHTVALIDEALVLGDLCGQALHQLDERRQCKAIPLVLQGIAEAVLHGPEARPAPPAPSEPQA